MQAWLGEQEPSGLAISDWVITEFSAALSMKLRSGQIEAIHRVGALAMFTRLSVDSLTIRPNSEMSALARVDVLCPSGLKGRVGRGEELSWQLKSSR